MLEEEAMTIPMNLMMKRKNPLMTEQRCKKWEIREIYLCYFFLAGANFGLLTQKFAQVPAAPVLSAPVGSALAL